MVARPPQAQHQKTYLRIRPLLGLAVIKNNETKISRRKIIKVEGLIAYRVAACRVMVVWARAPRAARGTAPPASRDSRAFCFLCVQRINAMFFGDDAMVNWSSAGQVHLHARDFHQSRSGFVEFSFYFIYFGPDLCCYHDNFSSFSRIVDILPLCAGNRLFYPPLTPK